MENRQQTFMQKYVKQSPHFAQPSPYYKPPVINPDAPQPTTLGQVQGGGYSLMNMYQRPQPAMSNVSAGITGYNENTGVVNTLSGNYKYNPNNNVVTGQGGAYYYAPQKDALYNLSDIYGMTRRPQPAPQAPPGLPPGLNGIPEQSPEYQAWLKTQPGSYQGPDGYWYPAGTVQHPTEGIAQGGYGGYLVPNPNIPPTNPYY